VFAREFAERDDEWRRWIAVVGVSGDPMKTVLDPARIEKEIHAFSDCGGSRLRAIIVQVGDSPYEEFIVGRMLAPSLLRLLQLWSERLETTVGRLQKRSGKRALKRTLLGGGLPRPGGLSSRPSFRGSG
jgi:hypothetical protein